MTVLGYPTIIHHMDSHGIIALIGTIRGHAYRFIQQGLDSRGMKGLAPSHGAILSLLFSREEISMGEISARIDRDKSTVTTLVQKLGELGYVTRRRDPHDGRMSYISLTSAGRALEPGFRAISKALIERTYKGFTKAERADLFAYLVRILHNWEGR